MSTDSADTGMLNVYRPTCPEYWCCCRHPYFYLPGVFLYRSPSGCTHHLLLCKEEEKEEHWTTASLLCASFSNIFWSGTKAIGHTGDERKCCIRSCETLNIANLQMHDTNHTSSSSECLFLFCSDIISELLINLELKCKCVHKQKKTWNTCTRLS